MLKLLNDYQQYISQLQQKLTASDDYLSKYSDKANLPVQIARQEQEIHKIIQQLNEKERIQKQIRQYKNNLIPDHYLLTSMLIREKWVDKKVEFAWSQYLKINHKLQISIKIRSIQPITKHHNPTQYQLNFDELIFHLHHIDQHNISPAYKYSPQFNLYQEQDIIHNKLLKGQRNIHLNIDHIIRSNNIRYYQHFLSQMNIKIVAESTYGLVLGVADLVIQEVDVKNCGRKIQKCIIFRNRCEDHNHERFEEFQNTLIGRIQFSINIHPIAPLVKQLQKNSLIHQKKRKTSKSKSPNRLISHSPSEIRSMSPKKKNLYLSNILKPIQQLIQLTIHQSTQYKHKLSFFNLSKGKQITYKQIQNIKQRRIQLIKINTDYFLKLYIERQNNNEKGIIMFQFNQQQYCIYVIQNNVFQIMMLQQYEKIARKEGQKHKIWDSRNKMVYLTYNHSAYIKPNIKIVKNPIKQTLSNGMLTNIFIKTPFQKCQIYTSLPFIITDIIHQQAGYLIYYYYQTNELNIATEDKLTIFLKSNFKQLIEIHIFDCLIQARLQQSQTIYKELIIKQGEIFYNLSLTLIANQNYNYYIRSSSNSIKIVNGHHFKYHPQYNTNLIIQLIKSIDDTFITDLIFYDNKYRCFFMKLVLIKQIEEEKEKDKGQTLN